MRDGKETIKREEVAVLEHCGSPVLFWYFTQYFTLVLIDFRLIYFSI